jgi:hypothetical protein
VRLLLVPLALAGACAPAPVSSPVYGTYPGESTRPYAGLPEYLVPAPPRVETRVGIYDYRVPVAGGRPFGPRETLERVRLRLAQIDAAAIALRTAAMPEPVAQRMERLADDLAGLLRERSDLAAEAVELQAMARRLRTELGMVRDNTLSRVERLTDLIRLQIDSG